MKQLLYSSLFAVSLAISTHDYHGMAQMSAEYMQAGIPDPAVSDVCPSEQCEDRDHYVDHRDCTCRPIPHACDFDQVWDAAIDDCRCYGTCDQSFQFNWTTCTCECADHMDCPDGQFWDNLDCRCKCIDHFATCTSDELWDSQKCQCVCKPQLCDSGSHLNSATCSCV